MGVKTNHDMVFPDLAFSLPDGMIPKARIPAGQRRIVGIGLMAQTGRLTPGGWRDSVHSAYLESLATLVNWLIKHDYDVRLITGDVCDIPVIDEFRDVLRRNSVDYEAVRVIDVPTHSVEDLLSELSRVDVVVATRFHNVLLALILHKPVVAISFHQKCTSLMCGMGLTQYCQEIGHLNGMNLIQLFCKIEDNSEELAVLIKRQVEHYRKALDDQYKLIRAGACVGFE
jgi:polysaccharide pyruvyl transferase WcaK-like protein